MQPVTAKQNPLYKSAGWEISDVWSEAGTGTTAKVSKEVWQPAATAGWTTATTPEGLNLISSAAFPRPATRSRSRKRSSRAAVKTQQKKLETAALAGASILKFPSQPIQPCETAQAAKQHSQPEKPEEPEFDYMALLLSSPSSKVSEKFLPSFSQGQVTKAERPEKTPKNHPFSAPPPLNWQHLHEPEEKKRTWVNKAVKAHPRSIDSPPSRRELVLAELQALEQERVLEKGEIDEDALGFLSSLPAAVAAAALQELRLSNLAHVWNLAAHVCSIARRLDEQQRLLEKGPKVRATGSPFRGIQAQTNQATLKERQLGSGKPGPSAQQPGRSSLIRTESSKCARSAAARSRLGGFKQPVSLTGEIEERFVRLFRSHGRG